MSLTSNKQLFDKTMARVVDIVRSNLSYFGSDYPEPSSVNGIYKTMKNEEWTTSFWVGLLWQSYLYTHDELFKSKAESLFHDFKNRAYRRICTNTHDLGFLYILSAKTEYLITGNSEAKELAIYAADLLMERYNPAAGILQAWGDINNPDEKGRMIIDCLMNLSLLFWVSEITGDSKYSNAASKHLEQTRKYIIRNDDTTFHTFFFDTETGMPIKGKTAQGYNDSSCWARGQAWGIYGLAIGYSYTKNHCLIKDAKRLANYFLNHLPDDYVCYWDLEFTSGIEERDSSAAAIAACGLIKLSSFLSEDDPDKERYVDEALKILESLSSSYVTEKFVPGCGILLHSVYNKPAGVGVDEYSTWGDYFFVEALMMVLESNMWFW